MWWGRSARWWRLVALIALSGLGLTILLVPATTSSGCAPGVLCLARPNPMRIWLTTVTTVAALLAVLAAWFAQRRATSAPPTD